MKAMLLKKISELQGISTPLDFCEVTIPNPGEGEILLKVSTCGVCHTELDEIEGRTPPPDFPVIPGHQVVGRIADIGAGVTGLRPGERVGVGWIFSACGKCDYCLSGKENLCSEFIATGRDVNGGYAEYMIVPAIYTYLIPDQISDVEAAPLLCAGAIGFRSIKLCNITDGETLGLIGFGASSHLVLKLISYIYPNTSVFVFTRSPKEQKFALELGATWAGNLDDKPPSQLNSIIDTTPAWKPIIRGMEYLKAGGRMVINAIRKENIDREWIFYLNYPTHLWMEKEIKSVANVTRTDIHEFLNLAVQASIKPEVQVYSLAEANKALVELKNRYVHGAKVLKVS